MSSRPPSRKDILLVLLGLLLIAGFGLRTISNSEFWFSLAVGRSIAENGVPRVDTLSFSKTGQSWIDPSWLYHRTLYTLWSVGGSVLVILVHVALVVAAFGLLLGPTRKWSGPLGMAFGLLLAGWLLAPRFTVGPLLLSLVFPALFLFILSQERKDWVPWAVLIPAQVLWSNLHPSFLLGPVICLLFGVETWSRERARGAEGVRPLTSRPVVQMAVLTVATVLVSLINPYGPKLYEQAFVYWKNPALVCLRDWISPFSILFNGSAGAKRCVTLALLISAGGLITERSKLPLVLTWLAVIVSALVAARSLEYHIDLFALLAFPFFCLSFSSLGRYVQSALKNVLKDRSDFLPHAARAVFLILFVLSLVTVATNRYYASTGNVSRFGVGFAQDHIPARAADVIEDPAFPEQSVNLLMDGGYLAWRFPGRKVFVDHRVGLYGPVFLNDLQGWLSWTPTSPEDEQQPEAFDERWDPQAVIVNCCLPFSGAVVRSLVLRKTWALIYFDGTTAILVKKDPRYETLIGNREIQRKGLELLEQERRRYVAAAGRGRQAPASPRLMGAGNLYWGLQRPEEAEAVYAALLRTSPSLSVAWERMGRCQLARRAFADAVTSLRTACRLEPKRADLWLWLSHACARDGGEEEARRAFARGSRLDPKLADDIGDPLAAAGGADASATEP